MKVQERATRDRLTVIDLERYKFTKPYIEGKLVLDIACGSAYGTLMLLEFGARKVVGVDIDKSTINHLSMKYATKSEMLEFKVGSAYDIPLPNSSVDVVVSIETLEHLENPVDFLKEIHKVMHAESILILSTPLNETESRFKPSNPYHVREYSQEELEQMLSPLFKNIKKFYQKSELRPNWITRFIDYLETNNIGIRKIKKYISFKIIKGVRKIAMSSSSTIKSTRIDENKQNGDVIIIVANKA